MNHVDTSLRAGATIAIAVLVSVSTGAATTAYGGESAARDAESTMPVEAPQRRIADLSSRTDHGEVSASPPVEYAQLASPDAECVGTEPGSSSGADQRLQQIADLLELSGDQIAEIQAIQMLADERFTPHITRSDLAEGVRAVLTGRQADCLIAWLLRGAPAITRPPAI